jgi:hypothetical protein
MTFDTDDILSNLTDGAWWMKVLLKIMFWCGAVVIAIVALLILFMVYQSFEVFIVFAGAIFAVSSAAYFLMKVSL